MYLYTGILDYGQRKQRKIIHLRNVGVNKVRLLDRLFPFNNYGIIFFLSIQKNMGVFSFATVTS